MNPPEFDTLIQMLAFKAKHKGAQTAFTFAEKPWTFGEIWQHINRFAGYLLQKGISQNNKVILALPNSPEFFTAFYGIQRAGGVAVPVFPDSGPDRILSIAHLSEAKAIIVSSPQELREIKKIAKNQGFKIPIVSVSESAEFSKSCCFPQIHSNDHAFIQYTSGSTGSPKGVLLSQANIITNISQMIQGMGITSKDIFVSWLPVYHDMGLILKTMVLFYIGAKLVLLPTSLINLRKWMDALHKHKATFTAAPDFAYRLLLAYIKNPDVYDLSNLRVALNAAEPVRGKTIFDFENMFHLKNIMKPAYGLAEATVGVSMWTDDKNIKVDTRGFVSIGKPFPEIKMGILYRGTLAGPNQFGEIVVRSPANTRGYYNNSKETSRLFWKKEYIRTGDIGYYDLHGHFYIIGRKKNIIIHSGLNISPQEIEEVIDLLPFVRFSAAVGIDRNRTEGEQVYVFVEVRTKKSTNTKKLHEISLDIVERFFQRFGFRPGRIYLVKPHTIPMTPNCKKQYSLLKRHYLNGTLRKKESFLYPSH